MLSHIITICFTKLELVMVLTELLQRGGVVMGIILVLSVYVLAVIIYKIYQFWRLEAFKSGYIDSIVESAEDKKYSEAVRIAGNHRSPLARVVETTIRCITNKNMPEDKKIRMIEASGSRELRVFESHLRGLEMAAHIAPLLGLLGTVMGIVKAFSGINQVGSKVDPSVLAGGIWEALLTTIAGLAVAIPALAAHYIVDGTIEKVRAKMKDTISYIMAKADS